MKWRKLGIVLVASMLACAAAAWAGEATTEYEWSGDLDCSICHQAEWESVQAVAAEEAETKDSTSKDANTAQTEAKAKDADSKDQDSASKEAKDTKDAKEAPAENESAKNLESYAAMHVQDFSFTCITCHEDNDKLAQGHNKLNSGKVAKRLKKTSIESKICLACHNMETLAKATADVDVLTDSNGTIVNPHDLPVNDSHAGITCSSCHKAHQAGEKALADTAYTTCISCHHEAVFECGTCHS